MGAYLNDIGSSPAASARPLIAICASEVRQADTIRPVKEDEPPSREAVLGMDYTAAVDAAGGIPATVPPLASGSLEALLGDRVAGLCLPGGPDLDPATYGEEPCPDLGPVDPDFDAFELELTARAVELDIPILAICRGMQVLNVCRGGTLIQHLPDRSTLSHRQEDPGDVPGHPIDLSAGSRIARIANADSLEINTFHHQAIGELGEGLKVTARAPDGVIEGVEDPERKFLVGVQWHAELMAARPVETGLFREFVDAAAARDRPRERVPG